MQILRSIISITNALALAIAFACLSFALSGTVAFAAQAEGAAAITFPLWPDAAPGALGSAEADVPTITVFLPVSAAPDVSATPDAAKENRVAAMIVFPGGGYGGLAKHEGEGYARWFAEHGMVAFVVKYRLGSKGYRHPLMLRDAARAVRLVRTRAAEWGVDPARVGVIGSSAGGHLASTLLTHFAAGRADDPDPVERQSSRPDLGILCYPVITMGEGTHGGSRNNLLGRDPSPELIEQLSSEKQVTEQTPPCFIWHTWEDKGVRMENSMAFAGALRARGVRFELHIYEKGGHGMGLGNRGPGKEPHRWAADCLAWLTERGFAR
jgi:acetyl esterase/lipase